MIQNLTLLDINMPQADSFVVSYEERRIYRNRWIF